MAFIFTSIYNFFSKRRLLLGVLLALLLGTTLWLSSRIKLEEDLSKMIPSDEKTEKLNFIFQNSKFMDKLVVNIHLKDTSAEAQSGKLIAYCDEFSDSVKATLMPDKVSEIRYKIENDIMFEVYSSIYNNLPVFLEEEDYAAIDSAISEKAINNSLRQSLKNLMSPSGMMTKEFIIKDPLGIASIALKKLREMQFDENYELEDGHIFANHKKNLLLFITPAMPSNETAANTAMIEQLDSLISKLEKKYNNEISTEYFGSVAIAVCNAERLKKDIITTVTIALIILLVFISLFFRRFSTFFMLFTPAVFGGLTALSLLYLFKAELSAIALGIGSVLLGITVDYSLHMFTHFRSKGNVRTVIKHISTPVFLSSLTTASAFLCLIFLHSEALFDLGLFAAISVLCAALFSMIVLPHLFKEKPAEQSVAEKPHKLTIIDRIVSYRFDKNKLLLLLIVLASGFFIYSSRFVQFESDMTKLGYMSDELIQAEQNLDNINNYKLRSVFLVSSGENLQEALRNTESSQAIIDSLKQSGIVKKYSTVSSLMISDELQKAKISRWNKYWDKAKKEKLRDDLVAIGADYKFRENAFKDFYALLAKDYKPVNFSDLDKLKNLFFSEYITESDELTTVVTLLKVARPDKPQVYKAFTNRENNTILDKEYLTNRFIDILKEDFNLLVIVSLIIVFIILTISFGRIELGLITFIPMALSWLWTLGIMGAFDIKFTIFSVVISTFIFGLGIDYSIFITRGLMQEYRYGYKNLNSYKTSIFLSAITTITGIGVLIFAWHPALKSIALLSVIGIISVVVLAYTIQPVLFWWLIRKKKMQRTVPVTIPSAIYAIVCYSYFISGTFITLVLSYTVAFLVPVKKARSYLIHVLIYSVCRSTIYVMFLMKKKIIIPKGENFKKPSIIICNHQSLIDIPLSLMFTPKTIVLTTDWVQKNFATGMLAKAADFYPVSLGLDALLPLLREKVDQGYSIFIFPEGSRSRDCKVRRFHKGAFYLAEQLKMDILPMVMHGTGHYVSKGEFAGKKSLMTVKFLDRIKYDDPRFGEGYSQKGKSVSKYFREEFEKISGPYRKTSYHKRNLINRYLYKGPVLEWYMKSKLWAEDNYKVFNELIPLQGKVTDLGCGYGFLSNLLALVSDKREIMAVDYDEDKIAVAANSANTISNVEFICRDIASYQLEESDAFIISDVLHYLTKEEQQKLLAGCVSKLKSGGRIIIKDGNCGDTRKHVGTRFTEFWSTKFGFNKTKNNLCYTSRSEIAEIVEASGMMLEVMEKSKITSNEVYLIRERTL